jgi:transcriptional regulator with XRE-family HTH domain
LLFVKLARVARGIPQHEIAKLLRVSRPIVSHIENGVWNPSPSQLAVLAQFFGCRPESLLKHVDESSILPPGTAQENGR